LTVEKLERVMWRLRARNKSALSVSIAELRRAIMYECGTDPTTYRNNKSALVRLGWIRKKGAANVWLTGVDMTGDDE